MADEAVTYATRTTNVNLIRHLICSRRAGRRLRRWFQHVDRPTAGRAIPVVRFRREPTMRADSL